jgi:hypothetical protein
VQNWERGKQRVSGKRPQVTLVPHVGTVVRRAGFRSRTFDVRETCGFYQSMILAAIRVYRFEHNPGALSRQDLGAPRSEPPRERTYSEATNATHRTFARKPLVMQFCDAGSHLPWVVRAARS